MRIESYRFGEIVIDSKSYDKDLIILPDRIIPNWWRDQGHIFAPEDCTSIFSVNPEVVIFGLGAYSFVRLSKELKEKLQELGISYQALSTVKACELFNQISPRQKVAAALHLTC
jgi:hypothetical protein